MMTKYEAKWRLAKRTLTRTNSWCNHSCVNKKYNLIPCSEISGIMLIVAGGAKLNRHRFGTLSAYKLLFDEVHKLVCLAEPATIQFWQGLRLSYYPLNVSYIWRYVQTVTPKGAVTDQIVSYKDNAIVPSRQLKMSRTKITWYFTAT